MSWVRLSDDALEHPKLVGLDAVALRTWLRVLCYASRHATDGLVADELLTRLGATSRVREQLTRASLGYTHGLWEPVEGGIRIHDYAEYQPTGARRAHVSLERAKAGQAGGRASGEKRRARGAPSPRGGDDQPALSSGHSDLSLSRDTRVAGNGAESLGTSEANCCEANEAPSRPVPSPERESASATPSVSIADLFPELPSPPSEWRAFAEISGATDVGEVFKAFSAHHRSKETRRPSWAAWFELWKKWLVDERRFQRKDRDKGRSHDPPGAQADRDQRARAEAARQRARDADDAEYRRNAVPAPIGQLLAAVGGSK